MKALTRDEIVKKTHGYKTEWVETPEWGGQVLVRELTAEEVTQIGATAISSGNINPGIEDVSLEEIAAVLPQIVSWAVVDENLNQLLTVADVRGMSAAHMVVIQRIAVKAFELSGLIESTEEDADPN